MRRQEFTPRQRTGGAEWLEPAAPVDSGGLELLSSIGRAELVEEVIRPDSFAPELADVLIR